MHDLPHHREASRALMKRIRKVRRVRPSRVNAYACRGSVPKSYYTAVRHVVETEAHSRDRFIHDALLALIPTWHLKINKGSAENAAVNAIGNVWDDAREENQRYRKERGL